MRVNPCACLPAFVVCRFPSLHKMRVYAADKDDSAAPDGEKCNKFAKTARGMTEGELLKAC